MTAIKERPILFSAPMVKVILDGRKTQTRRVVKFNYSHRVQHKKKQWHIEDKNAVLGCPHGHVGDRLWVRETFRDCSKETQKKNWEYRADESRIDADMYPVKWKPSIFMPRAASRITLEITGVRVERLNDISNEDCFAEGLPADTTKGNRTWYADLWESINGKGSWDANPWVWVIEFKKI